MITIKKSQSADTRSATKKVTKEELLNNSVQHLNDVFTCMNFMSEELIKIGMVHDHTKVENIDEFHKDFEAKQNGDPTDFKEMHWYKDIHIVMERHHLKANCPEDVNLFDVMEMIADITMAGMARTGGKVFDDDLSPEILQKAFKNTIELIKKNTKVVE